MNGDFEYVRCRTVAAGGSAVVHEIWANFWTLHSGHVHLIGILPHYIMYYKILYAVEYVDKKRRYLVSVIYEYSMPISNAYARYSRITAEAGREGDHGEI